jgi:hypothetical protein
MAKQKKTFSVDSDIVAAIQPLAKTYDVNLSEVVNNALFQVLQSLREIDKISSENPEGVPTDVARAFLSHKVTQLTGDTQSLVDELYPSKKKTKVKA